MVLTERFQADNVVFVSFLLFKDCIKGSVPELQKNEQN